MTDRPTIEHNPHERREPKWLWKAIFAGLALFWLLFLDDDLAWDQIGLGILTGSFLGMWAMEKTGGEVPASWRKSSRRR